MPRTVTVWGIVLMLVLAPPAALPAQGAVPAVPSGAAALSDSALDAMTRALSSELRCPVCQGLSLADSPSELALEMRDVIKDQLREGKSPEQVRQYFIGKYGEWILLEPQPHGLNLIVYVLPVLAVAGGLLLIWRAVRKWTTPAPGNPREIDARTGSPDA